MREARACGAQAGACGAQAGACGAQADACGAQADDFGVARSGRHCALRLAWFTHRVWQAHRPEPPQAARLSAAGARLRAPRARA